MYDVTIIYDNPQTIELFNMVPNKKDIFVEYIDINNQKDRSNAVNLKRAWGARKNPFVIVKNKDNIEKIFWSEGKDDAVNQLIKWINELD